MKFTYKQIIIGIIICCFVLGTIGLYLYETIYKRESDEDYFDEVLEIENNNNNSIGDDEIELDNIIIHITGCVKKQGIVILKSGDRIIDAINLAGGATEEADLNKINLAYELQDGEKIYVPSKEEQGDSNYLSYGESNYISRNYGKTSENDTLVNINKATKEQLQTLNGIGESMAKKIIKYREENGNFVTTEDIKNVPGIGDAKFENIKDSITVK